MISEDMFDLMMHMIGYGNLENSFKDVMSEYYKDEYDEELVFELATWCDDRWGGDLVKTLNRMKEMIE